MAKESEKKSSKSSLLGRPFAEKMQASIPVLRVCVLSKYRSGAEL